MTASTLFQSALVSSGQEENVQLLFIVSDGRISQQKGIRSLLREADELRILPVFVLIDTSGSILKVQVRAELCRVLFACV